MRTEWQIVLRASSNKTPFQRDAIHAEMAALKGCPRPEGKDIVLARLAPVKPAGAAADDEELEEGQATAPPSRGAKLLNAKPCSACRGMSLVALAVAGAPLGMQRPTPGRRCTRRCEFKMTKRGICRVYYTINAREIGVMQLNPGS